MPGGARLGRPSNAQGYDELATSRSTPNDDRRRPLDRHGATRLRNYFLTGLVIAAPLFLTVCITWTFVDWIDS